MKRLACRYRRLFVHGRRGFSMAKTYDVEVVAAGTKAFKEISLLQQRRGVSRRAARNIKFKVGGTGKAEYVHTLNGSGLAIGRNAGGCARELSAERRVCPRAEALRPYMGRGWR